MKTFMRAFLSILRFTIYASLKLLTFAVSVAFVSIQFVLWFVVLLFSVGTIGASTIDFGRRR